MSVDAGMCDRTCEIDYDGPFDRSNRPFFVAERIAIPLGMFNNEGLMDNRLSYVSLTIAMPEDGTKVHPRVMELLARSVKRSPDDLRVRLETGPIKLAKVVMNENLSKLISILEKSKFKIETAAFDDDTSSRRQVVQSELTSRSVRVLASPQPKQQSDWKKGDVIEGLYEVLGSASGGMGTVYFVFHRLWKMNLAIKTPHRAVRMNETRLARFLREAELWVDLGLHPNIATCYYARVIEGLPRLFIEYVDGGDLDTWHERKRLTDLRTVIDLMLQFCHGIIYAHDRGLIHRDIKPANCLISRDKILKITDFGLVKRVEDPKQPRPVDDSTTSSGRLTEAGLTMFEGGVVGSPWYMAPERFRVGAVDDIRSDIYSFGVMLYEIILDTRPFRLAKGQGLPELVKFHLRSKPMDPFSLRPDLPMALAEIIMTCLEKKPADRYQTFLDVCQALEKAGRELYAGHPVRKRPNLVGLKADSLNNQAVSLLDMGRISEAKQLLDDAHSTNTDHLEAVYNLHTLRWKLGELSDREVANRMGSLKIEVRDSADYSHLMGLICLQRGDPARGIGLLTKACQAAAHYAERWNESGVNPKQFVSSLGLGPIGEQGSLSAHVKNVRTVSFSPNFNRALTIGEDKTIRIWDIGSGRCLKNIRTFNFSPVAGAFSPDGKIAATSYGDAFKTVDVWDMDQGRLLRRHQGMAAFLLAFSPDSAYLAAVGCDGHIRVMDSQLERVVWDFHEAPTGITAAAFSDNGESLVVGTLDGSVAMIDLKARKPAYLVAAHEGPVLCLDVSSDGAYILSGGRDEILRLREASNGAEQRKFSGHLREIVGCYFLPDGQCLASASADGSIKIWDKSDGRCYRTIDLRGEAVTACGVSSDGKRVLIGGAKGSVRLWSLDTGWFSRDFLEPAICRPKTFKELSFLHDAFKDAIEAFEVVWEKDSPGEILRGFDRIRNMPGFCWSREAITIRNRVHSKYDRGRLRSWSFIRSFYGHEDTVVSLDAASDGLTLLTGSLDGRAGLWDVVTGRCIRFFPVLSPVEKVLFVKKVPGFFSWSRDGVLRRWSLDGNIEAEIPEVRLPLAISDDGRLLMAMTARNTGLKINLESGKKIFEGPPMSAGNFGCFSPQLDALYSLRDGTRIQRWSVTTGRNEGSLRDLGLQITSFMPTEQNDKVLAGMYSGDVIVYMVGSGVNVATLRGHSDLIRVVNHGTAPDLWITGSDDCTLRLWDLFDERSIAVLEGHASPVHAAVFFPNSSLIASAGADGSVRLWGLEWDLSSLPGSYR